MRRHATLLAVAFGLFIAVAPIATAASTHPAWARDDGRVLVYDTARTSAEGTQVDVLAWTLLEYAEAESAWELKTWVRPFFNIQGVYSVQADGSFAHIGFVPYGGTGEDFWLWAPPEGVDQVMLLWAFPQRVASDDGTVLFVVEGDGEAPGIELRYDSATRALLRATVEEPDGARTTIVLRDPDALSASSVPGAAVGAIVAGLAAAAATRSRRGSR